MADLTLPKKNNERFYDGLFVLLISGLIIFKFNYLSLPYFWDELGVYSQAADYQCSHAISLVPNSVPPELSRGHPLLFTFINSIPLRIFGSHFFVAHVFNLAIAVLLLTAFYLKISKHFNRLSAFSSAILLAVQPVFLAQSGLVIPEITVSLFGFLALVFFYEEKYFLYILSGSLVVLTKESGLVVPAAVLAFLFFQMLISESYRSKFLFTKLISSVIPFFVFGIFLLIQKQQNGWYFFPYHYNHLTINFETIQLQFLEFFDFVFWAQGRYWWIKILLIAPMLALINNRLNKESFKKSVVPLFLIFILGFFLFSSLSFFMERYVLIVIVIAALLVGVSLETIFRNGILVLTATTLLSCVAIQYLEEVKFNYDFDLGYKREINTLKSAIDYVSGFPGKAKRVYGNFPVNSALNFPNGGYMTNKNIIPLWHFSSDLDYVIINEPERDYELTGYRNRMRLVKTFRDGYSIVGVFEVLK